MTNTGYDTDFYGWTQAQAAALRAKDWKALDVDHLAEEIEALGKSDRRAVERHLKNLILHCLKWEHQPQERARRGRRWRISMNNAWDAIEQILRDNPSFQDRLEAAMTWAYPKARRDVHQETRIPLTAFPDISESTFEQYMDEELWR